MATATIGSLMVSLGLDSAIFQDGLKKAQSNLDKFSKGLGKGLAAVSVAGVAAATALGVAVKGAIDTADEMSKAAQKVGLSTEALSRLAYAADFSDVSLEQLTGGLQKLSKAMGDVASGQGAQAKTAFDALGISIKDSAGQLRDSGDVFADIADRFGRLEDGTVKTNLAIHLFGRSGAELIPLLNSGREGLKQMADESDRLGLTLNTKTGKQAEAFNDTLTKVGKILSGIVTQIAAAVLPQLQNLAEMLASPQVQQAAITFAQWIVDALGGITRAAVATVTAINDVVRAISKAQREKNPWNLSDARLQEEIDGARAILNNPNANSVALERSTPWLKALLENQNQRQGLKNDALAQLRGALSNGEFASPDMAGFFGSAGVADTPFKLPQMFTDQAASAAASAAAARLDALRRSLMDEQQLEMDSYTTRLEELRGFFDSKLLTKAEYDSLVEAAEEQHGDRMLALAQRQADEEQRIRDLAVSGVANTFGALSSLAESFGEKGLKASKAFAVAEAVVNTAQGVTKAMTLPFPANWAQAAAVAASGAAQIGAIMSASKGNASKPSVGGSAGSVPSVATPSAEDAGRNLAINVAFKGGGRYSQDEIEGVLRSIADSLTDGGGGHTGFNNALLTLVRPEA